MANDPPLYPGIPVLGSLLDFRNDRAELLRRAAVLHPEVVRFQVGPMRITLVAAPELVGHVLVKYAKRYPKRARIHVMMRDALGDGLLTANGESWARQRRLVQPTLRPDAIGVFADDITRDAEAFADQLAAAGSIDASAALHRLTMRIAGRVLLGVSFAADAERIYQAFDEAIRCTTARLLSPLTLPYRLPTPRNLQLRRAIHVLDTFLRDLIKARRANPGAGDDLLGRLLAAHEGADAFDDQELVDQVKALFIAGFETTATTLQWVLWELGRRPDLQAQVREEALGTRDPAELVVTRRVVYESMRRYPAGWAVVRMADEDDEIGGFFVPRDSMVLVSPYATHHLPAHWPDPLRFDPDRFLAERSEGRHRHAFLPFIDGPRRCVGDHLAILEVLLVTAAMVRRGPFTSTPDALVPAPVISLRPSAPVHLHVVG